MMNRDEDQSITQRELFSSIVAEAGAFYRLIVTVASSFLGGTLLFLERIAPQPRPWSIVVLAIGWLALIVSIILIVWVRAQNIRSGQHALEGRSDEARKLDAKKWCATTWSWILLAAGIFLIMMFGLINLVNGPFSKEQSVSKESEVHIEKATTQPSYKKHSIPYGSIQVPQSGPATSKEVTPSAGDSAKDSGTGGGDGGAAGNGGNPGNGQDAEK